MVNFYNNKKKANKLNCRLKHYKVLNHPTVTKADKCRLTRALDQAGANSLTLLHLRPWAV